MKKKALVEPMNLVESMEEIVEISKDNVDEEFGNKAKILKQPQGSWTTKIIKIKSRKMYTLNTSNNHCQHGNNYTEKNDNNGILGCVCVFPNSTHEFANLEACKYLNLRHFEELDKLCWQLWFTPPLSSLLKVSSSRIITKLVSDYSILAGDPNLCASITMHDELKCMWRKRWRR